MELCSCNHSNDPDGWPMAVRDVAIDKDNGVYLLPVCQECADTMFDPDEKDWILLVCGVCARGQWVHRKFARHGYPKDAKAIWQDQGCPKCTTLTPIHKKL